jgi:hypothetical protein
MELLIIAVKCILILAASVTAIILAGKPGR